jgi:glycosyltransferase involved in cell wall biosynthesis
MSRPEKARIAVVVLSVGAQPELKTAVASLLRQSVPVEIVVVNSGGGDVGARLPRGSKAVKVLSFPDVLWPGAARNRGIAATRSRWIAFLAADCLADDNWAAARLARHQQGHDAVASAVVNKNPRNIFAWASHLAIYTNRLPGTPERFASRFGVSYSRRLFKRHGLFREDLRIGEDSEFNDRLGGPPRLAWAPEVRTIHKNPTTFPAMVTDAFRRGMRRGEYWPIEEVSLYELIVTGLFRISRRSAQALHGRDRLLATASLPLVALCLCFYAGGVLRAQRVKRYSDSCDDPVVELSRRRPKLSHHIKPAARLRRLLPWRRPLVLAVFSFRYDEKLVPDLIENLRPLVDGWIAWDDRASNEIFSSEPRRRRALIQRARKLGANWILAVDPDERFEAALAGNIRQMTKTVDRTLWEFDLRELYAADSYRVDGVWGRKRQIRLFPLLEHQQFCADALHGAWRPLEPGYKTVRSGVNLYHLKMIARARREGRRRLYVHLDPAATFQQIGYDYLCDEEGAVFEQIPPGRHYLPKHEDDGGLWMADVGGSRSDVPAAGQPVREMPA